MKKFDIYEEYDVTDLVSLSLLERFNDYKIMKSGLMKLNWANVKSILVYGFLSAVLFGLISLGEAVVRAGSLFTVDWSSAIDLASVKVVSIFVMSLSLIKNLLTTNSGNFVGAIKVISDVKK